jgi:hypothetical protein
MSTIKADSVQPTIAGNNLILKSGSGDVERVRISPTGQITFASTTGTTFSGDVNFANATRFPAGIGVGGGFAGTPYTALDVVHTNASLLDPGVNNYNSTRGRSNLSIRGSGTNTTLFLGNAADAAVWLQAQNSDNTQKAISLNPVGGFVGIGLTGPTSTLHINGDLKINSAQFNPSGSAPLYGCRAFGRTKSGMAGNGLDFSSNCTSCTFSSGIYTVNLTTAMPDTNYTVLASLYDFTGSSGVSVVINSASQFTMRVYGGSDNLRNTNTIQLNFAVYA